MWKFWKEENKQLISLLKLTKIKDESILEEEHRHINRLIEQKNTFGHGVITFFTSAILSAITYGITQTFSFLTSLSSDVNQQEKDLREIIYSFVDFLLATGSWFFIFLMILFLTIVISYLLVSAELKKYKETVIQLRSKVSNQKARNLKWKKSSK